MTETGPAGTATARDPQRPARLLRAEHDALLPVLRRTDGPAFDRPTACPGWSVRDVLAHCGDVRAALGEPLAYAGDGFADACVLLGDWTRRRAVPLVEVTLPGSTLCLGAPVPGRPRAALRTSHATLMRLFAGRPADPADYQLAGAVPDELVVF